MDNLRSQLTCGGGATLRIRLSYLVIYNARDHLTGEMHHSQDSVRNAAQGYQSGSMSMSATAM